MNLRVSNMVLLASTVWSSARIAGILLLIKGESFASTIPRPGKKNGVFHPPQRPKIKRREGVNSSLLTIYIKGCYKERTKGTSYIAPVKRGKQKIHLL
jgi:hypothetical protein